MHKNTKTSLQSTTRIISLVFPWYFTFASDFISSYSLNALFRRTLYHMNKFLTNPFNKFSANPFKRFPSFNWPTHTSFSVRTFKEFFLLNEFQYCWQPQWRHLGDHIPPPRPCLLISLLNLITVLSRRLPPLKEHCGLSLHSSPSPQILLFSKRERFSSFGSLYLEQGGNFVQPGCPWLWLIRRREIACQI